MLVQLGKKPLNVYIVHQNTNNPPQKRIIVLKQIFVPRETFLLAKYFISAPHNLLISPQYFRACPANIHLSPNTLAFPSHLFAALTNISSSPNNLSILRPNCLACSILGMLVCRDGRNDVLLPVSASVVAWFSIEFQPYLIVTRFTLLR